MIMPETEEILDFFPTKFQRRNTFDLTALFDLRLELKRGQPNCVFI